MNKLFILADDMTGTLDTAVKFAAAGVRTYVAIHAGQDIAGVEAQVIVMNADTRHKAAATAYDIVRRATLKAVAAGATHLFKKVDSSLRGNIGAELTAMLAASGKKSLSFVPAFPQMGRVTREGTQWVNGLPVHKSEFGEDPFEAVNESFIPDIIARQSDVETRVIKRGEVSEAGGINIYDGETDSELLELSTKLNGLGLLSVMAGSAGLAETLPGILKLEKKTKPFAIPDKEMLIICGSVNPVTQLQIEHAKAHGFLTFYLDQGSLLQGVSDQQYQQIKKAWQPGRSMIVATSTDNLLQSESMVENRCTVSDNLGKLSARLISDGVDAVYLATGGDTLLSILEQLEASSIEPVSELKPGVVLSRVFYRGQELCFISKAGGFGEERLFSELRDYFIHREVQRS